MNTKNLLILLGCTSYILARNTSGLSFLRADSSNTTDATPSHTVAHTDTTHNMPPASQRPIQTTKCVVKGEWFQKCVNAKEKVKWNEQYKRTDHCFRYGICQVNNSKCEWKSTKEMSNCLEDMKKGINKVITE